MSEDRPDELEEKCEDDEMTEEDLVRAFAKISQTRRESSISISDACRLFTRQNTRCGGGRGFHL